MIDFEKPIYFVLLLLLPILYFINYWYKNWQTKSQAQFGEASAIEKLKVNKKASSKLPFSLFIISVFMLIIALINPKIGANSETIKGLGAEIVLAIDVSKSMLCQDVAPTRMEKAKQIATQIVNNMQADRVGIVAYAATANTTVPMTTDYAMAKMQISSLDTNMISSQGTGIKNAIEAAVSYFDNPKTAKVIVLITDGEDHENDATDISSFAADKNIKMITIGIGTINGGNITYLDELGNTQLKQDNQGNVVISKLNENILKEIATKTNGTYIANKSTAAIISEVKNALLKIEKSEFKTQQLNEKQSQFQWFLAIAIILFGLLFINENIKNI